MRHDDRTVHLVDRERRPVCAGPYDRLHHYITAVRFDQVRCIRCNIIITATREGCSTERETS